MQAVFSDGTPSILVGLRGTGGAIVVLLLWGLLGVFGGWAQPTPADSLSLAEQYQIERFRMLVQTYLDDRTGVPPRPARWLPTDVDSLVRPDSSRQGAPPQKGSPDPQPSFPIADVRHVRDLEASWFQRRYRGVEWSFLGTGTRLTFFDTTRTRELRARLQSVFGDPTRTMTEIYSKEWRRAPESNREDPIQFAYWFVVNDSIPVQVSDVNGPAERGVIVSTDREHRDRLFALRAALLKPLRRAERAPYVDYYYEEETRRWYRVGFDGQSFFRERISRFDITPGRRPYLPTRE